MSTSNPRPWEQGETQPAQKVEPWMAFGLALIVSVASLLFAAGTWIVRSNQTNTAIVRAAALQANLSETEAKRKDLESKTADQDAEITALTAERKSLTERLARTEAEVEAARRDLAGSQGHLADARQSDADPTTLPFGRLPQVISADRTVGVDVHVQGDGLAKGPISEFVKDRLGREWTVAQSGRSTLVVSVVATSVVADIRSLGVLLELRQDWKIPSQSLRLPVTIWRNHTVGITSDVQVQSFVETMLEDLFKALETQLQSESNEQ